MRRRRTVLAALLAMYCAPAAGSAIEVRLEPLEASIGDALELEVRIETAPDVTLQRPDWKEGFGPFSVLEGEWASGPREGSVHVWQGRVAAYRVGELEFPALSVRVDGGPVLRSEPIEVVIVSVIPDDDAAGELAGLKEPASVPMDLRPLWVGTVIAGSILILAAAAWWMVRRYGERLAAKPTPADPFHRVPPHEWAYQQLKALLDSRLAEEGAVDPFFTRLSWILRRYLGGRFRVEIMERTTAEIVPLLRQAGAAADATSAAERILIDADMIKYARFGADPSKCRSAVESTYAVIDSTRPTGDG